MKYLVWFPILLCTSLGISGLLSGNYGEALQYFLLSTLLIGVFLGKEK